MPNPAYLVRVELQRIQTFLFAVPRLRAMLGANALLGHTLRYRLPQALAGRGMPCTFDPVADADLKDAPADPLDNAPQRGGGSELTVRDRPQDCYERGILARDGGHFAVAFGDGQKEQAEAFVADAYRLLARELPGLKVSIRLQEWRAEDTADDANADETAAQFTDDGIEQPVPASQLPMLPQFQVCTQSGFGAASRTTEPKASDEPMEHQSQASRAKVLAGQEFQRERSPYCDLVSLLRDQLPGYIDGKKPDDLEDLADDGGYIALIHADGNRIGKRLTKYRDCCSDRWQREVQTEHFFHRMRGVVRHPVIDALGEVFTPSVLEQHRDCIPISS